MVEILVVLVVLGVVAGLSFPVILGQVERSRANEALVQLDATKDALLKFYSLNGTYVGATFLSINYDPNVVDGGQSTSFSYKIGNLSNTQYTITAQREPAASNVGNTIILDQTGTVTKNGAYA